jgi:hypothetical protein
MKPFSHKTSFSAWHEIVPYPAGLTDAVGRQIAAVRVERLKQPVAPGYVR